MRVELLSAKHDRFSFSCGVPVLDSYIKERATQDVRRGLCAVHVLAENRTIVGFYTISPFSVHFNDLPPLIAKKFPKNIPIPCWLIGRLAVDDKFKGQRFGEKLLMDALYKIIKIAGVGGGFCVILDAKEERIKPFYERYGFKPIKDDKLRLYLPLNSIPGI